MHINKEQAQEVNEFILKYNADKKFKEETEEEYNNNPEQLSILVIYALEEILRFGDKGIYKKFLIEMEGINEEKAIDQYKSFLKLYKTDENFRYYKSLQLKERPETLSKIENFAFSMIIKNQIDPKKLHEELTDQLEYSSLNPIKNGNDDEIKETLTNLIFGELILEILELPEMKPIKVRQKQIGMVADIDKPTVIDAVQKAISGSEDKLVQAVETLFIATKFNILIDQTNPFKEYLKFNTNISAREIYEIETLQK